MSPDQNDFTSALTNPSGVVTAKVKKGSNRKKQKGQLFEKVSPLVLVVWLRGFGGRFSIEPKPHLCLTLPKPETAHVVE
jgi:hypothetical protein